MILTSKRNIFLIFLISFILINVFYFPKYNFTKNNEFDDFYIVRILKNAFQKYYASILWVRIDEFYHIKKDFRNDIYKQISMLEMFNTLSKDNHIGAIYLSYMYSKNLKNYDKALNILNEFIHKNPKHNKIHKILGEIGFINLFFTKDYENAEQALLIAFELSKTKKVEKEDPLEYLFYGNYIKMLRMLYKTTENNEQFEFYDNVIKDMKIKFNFSDSEFHEEHPVYFIEDGEHGVFHNHDKDEHHHHKHEHFDSKFLWEKSYIEWKLLLFLLLLIFIKISLNNRKIF
ncbi:MAG: hypothetical protein M0R46_07285 [Candidatus Muirbacterium halophilum]|nr:hypothetical protein [Candidatus Muirbacterium halophilum]MCK9475703.1 hypothetical protein [Candidatus Muirbacterium halophilum]